MEIHPTFSHIAILDIRPIIHLQTGDEISHITTYKDFTYVLIYIITIFEI